MLHLTREAAGRMMEVAMRDCRHEIAAAAGQSDETSQGEA